MNETAWLGWAGFLVGACVGSFLNVCIYRMPLDQSVVVPRSFCPACGRTIAWFDNLPLISWFVLGGRCRGCRMPISLRYLAVELLTACCFFFLWTKSPWPHALVYSVAASGLIAAAFIDAQHYIIPNEITFGGLILGPLAALGMPSLTGGSTPGQGLLFSLAGIAVGMLFLLAVRFLGRLVFRKEAMGLGDVKLLGAIGGLFGIPSVLFTVFISALTGSLTGMLLVAFGRKRWVSRIPYGPFLAAGALLWILRGPELVNWYWNVFTPPSLP